MVAITGSFTVSFWFDLVSLKYRIHHGPGFLVAHGADPQKRGVIFCACRKRLDIFGGLYIRVGPVWELDPKSKRRAQRYVSSIKSKKLLYSKSFLLAQGTSSIYR